MSRGRRDRRRHRATSGGGLPQRGALALEPVDPDPVATQPLPPELSYPRLVTPQELTDGKDDQALTAELADALRQVPPCSHCGGRHVRACPRVKRMSFHPSGALASVDFWPGDKWSDEHVLWDEDIGG